MTGGIGEISVDIGGPLPISRAGGRFFLVVIKRNANLGFVEIVPSKSSLEMVNAVKNMQLSLRKVWQHHRDGGREFLGNFTEMLKAGKFGPRTPTSTTLRRTERPKSCCVCPWRWRGRSICKVAGR